MESNPQGSYSIEKLKWQSFTKIATELTQEREQNGLEGKFIKSLCIYFYLA